MVQSDPIVNAQEGVAAASLCWPRKRSTTARKARPAGQPLPTSGDVSLDPKRKATLRPQQERGHHTVGQHPRGRWQWATLRHGQRRRAARLAAKSSQGHVGLLWRRIAHPPARVGGVQPGGGRLLGQGQRRRHSAEDP